MATLKAKLTPEFLRAGNPREGRVLFTQLCASCHKLYGEGGTLGPDLTGSGRHDIGYLIENLADPGAVVAADYRVNVVTLKDGRVLNGMLAAQSDRTLTLRSATEETTVDRANVSKHEQLPASMMPDGLLTALDDAQLRNLLAYLMSDRQVPAQK